MVSSDSQREDWLRLLESRPDLAGSVFGDDTFEDEQPSVEEIMSGEAKSPPALEGGNATYGVFRLAGYALKPTNEKCGIFLKVKACTRVELHNKAVFDKDGKLVDCRGKGYFKPVFHSCDKPSCPRCYEHGWAIREAGNVDFRLEQASKRFGQVEHIIVCLPSKYWGLTEQGLRSRCMDALYSRGIIGGALIFHGFRYNSWEEARSKGQLMGWYWSPHFHILGFILGGYGKCRHCKGKCHKGCGGFVVKNYRLNEADGCYVKVKGKRKTIFGTAWYQLHHSTIRTDVKRFHVVTWFGVCSYRRLKLSKELRAEYDESHRQKCPICGSDLVRHEYCGRDDGIIALFRKRRGARESVKGFYDKASDWREVAERGSGSYQY
jgi:hypothetical protein